MSARNHFRRLLAGTLVAFGLVLSAVGVPASAASTSPISEAWYQHTPIDEQASPLCTVGLPGPGCSGDVVGGARGSTYPEQTLHVSVINGFVDTSTVIELERPSAEATTNGFVLEMPLAPEEDGTANSGSARVQLCLATGEVEDGAEAAPPGEAPAADCTVAARALPRFEDAGGVTFVADLVPLLEATGSGPLVVAIVPTEAALSESDTWHLAFSARDRADASTPGLSAVTVEPVVAPPPPVAEPAPEPRGSQPATGPLFPAPVAMSPPLAAPEPAPEVANPAPPAGGSAAPPEVGPSRLVFPVGLLYPGVFAVPLALVIVGGSIAVGLGRPLPLDETPGEFLRAARAALPTQPATPTSTRLQSQG